MGALLLKELKNRWFEYLLGAGLIALVVSVLVAQRSVNKEAGEKVHELAHKLGKNMLVLPSGADLPGFYSEEYGEESMPEDYPDRIFGSSAGRHISLIEPQLYANVELDGVPISLVGSQVRLRGREKPERDESKRVLLTAPAAEKLGVKAGETVTLMGKEMKVTSIGLPKTGSPSDAAYIPLGTAQELLGRPGRINAMRMGGCWCKVDVPTLAGNVEKELPDVRALTASNVVAAQKETVKTMGRYSSAINFAGTGLVGGMVFAITLSRVRRRRREIGLLIAVGAPPWKVNSLFVLRAAITGVLGGGLGYLLGIPVTEKLAAKVLDASLTPSADRLPEVLAMCVAVSVVFAYLPSRHATSLDPTAVLREE